MARRDRLIAFGILALLGGLIILFVGLPILAWLFLDGAFYENWGWFLGSATLVGCLYCLALLFGAFWALRRDLPD